MAITIPNSTSYNKNSGIPTEHAKCVVCAQECSPDTRYWLHVHHGGGVAVTEEEAAILDESSDLGMQPIGENCLKKHPELRPYVQDSKPPRKTKTSIGWKALYYDLYRQTFSETASDSEIAGDARRRTEFLSYK